MEASLTENTAATASAIVPLNRRTLHDELVGRVRTLIVEGQFLPEKSLHEGRLGKAHEPLDTTPVSIGLVVQSPDSLCRGQQTSRSLIQPEP